MSTITLHGGTILKNVHEPAHCYGPNCCIHNPSDHPLNTAPLAWWGTVRAMFRVCEHGVHHPDPDDLDFMLACFRFIDVEAICAVHLMKENCDGCCQPKPEPHRSSATGFTKNGSE